MMGPMASTDGDFELTVEELRIVVRLAVRSAQDVLEIFEADVVDDDRPRAAVEAALVFANGGPRTNLQRTASVAAHRAGKDARSEAAGHAARSAGDAAAAAYLHPLAQSSQVGHILRATAHAARAAELRAGGDAGAGEVLLEAYRGSASPALLDVLGRYPVANGGSNSVGLWMKRLDTLLREESTW